MSTDNKASTAATYATRRHSIFPSECSILGSIAKEALLGKDGSDGCCGPHCVQRCYIRKLVGAQNRLGCAPVTTGANYEFITGGTFIPIP